MTCPSCGSSVLFHSRRQRRDGVLRSLFYSAFRCRACGHRHFRISLIALAVLAAVLLSVTLIGVGEVVWTHHAQEHAQLLALAQAATGSP